MTYEAYFEGDDTDPPVAGSSRHAHALDLDDEDKRVEVIHPTAGRVIRIEPTLHERWRREFGGTSEDVAMMCDTGEELDSEKESDRGKYYPFATELDWQVASWAVQEGIGHGSFDRLLAIPGVGPLSVCYSLVLT